MRHRPDTRTAVSALVISTVIAMVPASGEPVDSELAPGDPGAYLEQPDAPYRPNTMPPTPTAAGQSLVVFGQHVSYQVNVDADGNNIRGDAANEPSIAVSPTNPNHMAIGWRQFDTVESNFRQGGYAYTRDGGMTWTFPGVLEDRVFRSDPVLDVDTNGDFLYLSLAENFISDVFRSTDRGATWTAFHSEIGGDKHWLAVDHSDLAGRGNIYNCWNRFFGCCGQSNFSRSTDGGVTFDDPVELLTRGLGTLTVAPDGVLHVVGQDLIYLRSSDAADPAVWPPTFEVASSVNLGGFFIQGGPNPGGLTGQPWIAVDPSPGPRHGYVYVLGTVNPFGVDDPLDVHFTVSTNGGLDWSEPVRVNEDSEAFPAYQWFGTMSIAPNGRVDVIWNDTRNRAVNLSQLYYAFSTNGGTTWSHNEPVSPVFNSFLGWPNQNKLGDYYDMVSDNFGVSIAYAATFNDEQDVYYLRIGGRDCNLNEIEDRDDIASGTSEDCNANQRPDECDRDCNANRIADDCEESALIEAHPQSQQICPGSTAQMTIAAPSAEAFQWFRDETPLQDDSRITGSQSATLTIQDASFEDDGLYTCRVNAQCLVSFANPAQLTVIVAAEVTTDPPATSARCLGQTLVLSIATAGTNLAFEWRKNGVPLAGTERISGVDADQLMISNVDYTDAGQYDCLIQDPCGGEDLSRFSAFSVASPLITQHPQPTCVESGNTLVLHAEASTSLSSIGYAWRRNGTLLVDDGRVSGSNSPTLTVNDVLPIDAGLYSVTVFSLPSPICVTESELAEVTVGDCPCASTAHCPNADVDCSGIVDESDLAMIANAANWGLSVSQAAEPRTDVDGDGTVTGLDAAIVTRSNCFGR